jgi:hypothetical protein
LLPPHVAVRFFVGTAAGALTYVTLVVATGLQPVERALAARERAATVLGISPAQMPLQPAGALWRVFAGPYPSRGDAVSAGERLRQGTDLQPIPITVGP